MASGAQARSGSGRAREPVEGLDRVTEQATQSLSEQQPSELESRLQRLERVTGLRESELSDSVVKIVSDGFDDPIPITEQVSKLSDTVTKLSEDVELAKADRVMVGELNQKLKEAHNSLVAVVNNHCDVFNKNFKVHRSKIDKIQKMVRTWVKV